MNDNERIEMSEGAQILTLNDFIVNDSVDGFTPKVHFEQIENVVRDLFTQDHSLK